jgi:hypothetical protein
LQKKITDAIVFEFKDGLHIAKISRDTAERLFSATRDELNWAQAGPFSKEDEAENLGQSFCNACGMYLPSSNRAERAAAFEKARRKSVSVPSRRPYGSTSA